MCKHAVIILAASAVLALAGFASRPAQAQSEPTRPAVQDLASEPIGRVVTATGSVTIEHVSAVVVQANLPTQADQTKVGDLVYLGDVVQTGANGRVSINFTDGTSFNLSSNARMALDEYVYDPKGKSNSTMFNLTKGAFTFVAGNIAHTGDMKVDTPVATMGIRGTTPHVEISDDGTTKFDTLIEEGKNKLKPQFSKLADRYFQNVELCNGLNRTSLDARIGGCTSLIDARQGTPTTLAIAYNNRGNAYTAKSDYDHAIQDFDQSIKLNPAYVKPLNNRGVAYLRKGQYDLAIQAFDEAIAHNPNYGEAFANRAGAHLKKNEYDRAAHDYDIAIALDPNLKAVWSGRCWTRAILGALQDALEDCNRALQGTTDAATYDSRGLIRLKLGQPAAAIDDYSSALRSDPKLASALYGRGLAKLKMGDRAGSDADISAAKTSQANIGDDFARYGVR
jgi:tetratricopeptide (TPR) repeat protein